jgi:hypothetical protein
MLDKIEQILADEDQFEDVCASLLAKYGEVPDGWPELQPRRVDAVLSIFTLGGVVLYASVIFCLSCAIVCATQAYDVYQTEQKHLQMFAEYLPQASDPLLPDRKRSQKQIGGLVDWITKNGGQCSKVRIDSDGGLRAAQAIRGGEAILSIPAALQLTSAHAEAEISKTLDAAKLEWAKTGQSVPEDISHIDKWPHYSQLAIFVMMQRADPDSFWHSYTRMLPDRANPLPIHYTPAQISMLQESPVKYETEKTRTHMHTWFQSFCSLNVMPSICECDKEANNGTGEAEARGDGGEFLADEAAVPLCGYERFLWAWGAVRSRSFGSSWGGRGGRQTLTEQQREQREQQQAQQEQQCDGSENVFEQVPHTPPATVRKGYAMAPLADMANHGVPTSATYLTAITITPSLLAIAENLPFELPFNLGGGEDEKAERRVASFMLIATRNLEEGQSILIDYGERPGMLQAYGFQPDRTGMSEVYLYMHDTPIKFSVLLSLSVQSIEEVSNFLDLCSQQQPRPLPCDTGGKRLQRDLELMRRVEPETAFSLKVNEWVFDKEIEQLLREQLQEEDKGQGEKGQGEKGQEEGREEGREEGQEEVADDQDSLVVSFPAKCEGQEMGTVWGNGEYYAASSICAAAVHAHGDDSGGAGTPRHTGPGSSSPRRRYRIRFGTCSFQGNLADGVSKHGIQTIAYSPELLAAVGENVPGINWGKDGIQTRLVRPETGEETVVMGDQYSQGLIEIQKVYKVEMDSAAAALLLERAQEAAKTAPPTRQCFTVEQLRGAGGKVATEGDSGEAGTTAGATAAAGESGWSAERAAFLNGIAAEDTENTDSDPKPRADKLARSRIFRGFVRTALSKLQMSLEQYGSSIEEDEALLVGAERLPFVERNCVLLRLWEKRVLRWYIRLFESFVDVMEGRWVGSESYVVMQVPSSWRGAGSGGSERVTSSIVVPTWLAKDKEFGSTCGVQCLRLFGKAKAAWLS